MKDEILYLHLNKERVVSKNVDNAALCKNGAITFSLMTLNMMTLNIKTFSRMKLSIKTFS